MILILISAFLWLPVLGIIIAWCRLHRESQTGRPLKYSVIVGLLLALVCSLFYSLVFAAGIWHHAVRFNLKICLLCSVGSSAAALLIALSDGKSKWVGIWCTLFTTIFSPILLVLWILL